MESFCVEAYLETAHLTGEPVYDWEPKQVALKFKVESPGPRVSHAESSTEHPGYVVDRDVITTFPPGITARGEVGGYTIDSVNDAVNLETLSGYSVEVLDEKITITGYAEGIRNRRSEEKEMIHGNLEVHATVYLKKKTPKIVGRQPGLLITGRAVCSCPARRIFSGQLIEGPSVVYEKPFFLGERQLIPPRESGERQLIPPRESMSINEANQMGADLKRELLESLSSADRYPRGMVGVLDTQLVAGMLGAHIRHAGHNVNYRLSDWASIDENIARRVTAYAPAITRSQLLEMPLAQQVENFGLSFAEAVTLRRALTDISEPSGPPPVPRRQSIEVPLIKGMQLHEARAAVTAAGLLVGAMTQVDSALPSGSIVAQVPDAGATVDSRTEVSVQIASGLSVRMPAVIGSGLSEAACRLRDAGLQSEPTVYGNLVPDAVVVSLEPPVGTLVTPGTPVTIRLDRQPHGPR
jgi:hypothetical protein